jgi:hypothetical protein
MLGLLAGFLRGLCGDKEGGDSTSTLRETVSTALEINARAGSAGPRGSKIECPARFRRVDQHSAPR